MRIKSFMAVMVCLLLLLSQVEKGLLYFLCCYYCNEFVHYHHCITAVLVEAGGAYLLGDEFVLYPAFSSMVVDKGR